MHLSGTDLPDQLDVPVNLKKQRRGSIMKGTYRRGSRARTGSGSSGGSTNSRISFESDNRRNRKNDGGRRHVLSPRDINSLNTSNSKNVRAQLEHNSDPFDNSNINDTSYRSRKFSQRPLCIQKSIQKRKLLEASRTFNPTPYGSRQESFKRAVAMQRAKLSPEQRRNIKQISERSSRIGLYSKTGKLDQCSRRKKQKKSNYFNFNFKDNDKKLDRLSRCEVKRCVEQRNKRCQKSNTRRTNDRCFCPEIRKRSVRRKRFRRIKNSRCESHKKPKKAKCPPANKFFPSSGSRGKTSGKATGLKKPRWQRELEAQAKKSRKSDCGSNCTNSCSTNKDKNSCRRKPRKCNCQQDKNPPHCMYLVKRCLFNYHSGANEKEIIDYVKTHYQNSIKSPPKKFEGDMKRAVKNMNTLGYTKKSPINPAKFILTSRGRVMRLRSTRKTNNRSRMMARRVAKYNRRKKTIVKLH